MLAFLVVSILFLVTMLPLVPPVSTLGATCSVVPTCLLVFTVVVDGWEPTQIPSQNSLQIVLHLKPIPHWQISQDVTKILCNILVSSYKAYRASNLLFFNYIALFTHIVSIIVGKKKWSKPPFPWETTEFLASLIAVSTRCGHYYHTLNINLLTMKLSSQVSSLWSVNILDSRTEIHLYSRRTSCQAAINTEDAVLRASDT